MIASHLLNIVANTLAVDNAIYCSVRYREKNDVRRGALFLSASTGAALCARAIFLRKTLFPFKVMEFSALVIDLGANGYSLKKEFSKEKGIFLLSTALSVARVGLELSRCQLGLHVDFYPFDKVWVILAGLEIVSRFLSISLREPLA